MDVKRWIAKGLRVILQPPAITNSDIAKTSKACSGSHINNSQIGKYSYVGHDCFLSNVQMGSFVSIADNCRIGGAAHPMERVSTSPVFHAGKNVMKKNFADFPMLSTPTTTIGSDVWIGANTVVISGVNIASGAVVGAGSVVTKDIGPYEIWAGNPAKKIRNRFEEHIIDGMLSARWWEWNDEKIMKYVNYFDSPTAFLKELGLQEELR